MKKEKVYSIDFIKDLEENVKLLEGYSSNKKFYFNRNKKFFILNKVLVDVNKYNKVEA